MRAAWFLTAVFIAFFVSSCASTPVAQKKPEFAVKKGVSMDSPIKKEQAREIGRKPNLPKEASPVESARAGRPEILTKEGLREGSADIKAGRIVETVEIGRIKGGGASGDKKAAYPTEATLKLMNDNPVDALWLFKPAGAIEAGRWEFYYNSGLLYMRMGDVEKAQEAFLTASRYNAPPAKIYNALGTLYALGGNNAKAIESFNGAFMLERSFSTAVNFANAHLGMGHTKEAAKLYLDAESFDSTNPLVHYNMGILFFSEGDYEGAFRQFTAAMDYGRKDFQTLSGRAQALLRLRRYDEALKAFEEIRDIAPDDPRPYRNIGIICEIYLGDMDKALENYSAYLQKGGKDSGDVQAWLDVVKARVSVRGEKDEN